MENLSCPAKYVETLRDILRRALKKAPLINAHEKKLVAGNTAISNCNSRTDVGNSNAEPPEDEQHTHAGDKIWYCFFYAVPCVDAD